MSVDLTKPHRILSGQEALDAFNAIMGRVVREAIAPHLERIEQLASRGKFVGLVFEPHGDAETQCARDCGWDGSAPVWPMTKRSIRALAETDHVTRRWLTTALPSEDRAKVFAVIQSGTYLLNGDADGWRVEPGSLNADALN